MEMSGQHTIPAPRETVWEALNDPEVLKQCIPGCEEVNKTSDTSFDAKVSVKVGPVKAKFGGAERAGQIYETIRQNGTREGIDFRLDLIKQTPNTVRAHRLIRWASERGHGDPLVERMFTAYFTEGVDLGDIDRLADIAEEIGLSLGEVAAFLETSDGLTDVLAETRFAYESGINGVPCFIFDRHYALAGAQEPEAFYPLFELVRNEAANRPAAANHA